MARSTVDSTVNRSHHALRLRCGTTLLEVPPLLHRPETVQSSLRHAHAQIQSGAVQNIHRSPQENRPRNQNDDHLSQLAPQADLRKDRDRSLPQEE